MLFTKEELINNAFLEPHQISAVRQRIDMNRVSILKEAIKYKFKLSATNFAKIWSPIRVSLNGKGRNLKYQRKVSRALVNVQ